ncbi:MAG: hypothetical protein K2O18_07370 [Oscillospiraceae bacterium]|nr:hypothetical protein [Oscillospiraceae bacterium]
MKNLFARAGRLWCAGAVLLVLRLLQNKSGFDVVTGLSKPSVPASLLMILIAACAGAELFLCTKLPKRSADFADLFAPPEKELTAAVCGSLLLAAGGGLLAADAFLNGGTAASVAGLLALAAGAGLVAFNRSLRAGEQELPLLALLPLLFFSVFFVLAVYLPLEDDPVFFRYYLPILSAAVTACAFSLLAGFCRHESSLRAFQFTADMAVILCLAAAADAGTANRLLYIGCAVILSVYLVLRREPEELPEEPEEPEKEQAKA